MWELKSEPAQGFRVLAEEIFLVATSLLRPHTHFSWKRIGSIQKHGDVAVLTSRRPS